MILSGQMVVFSLGAQRYALRLSAVQRIVYAVDVTPLPSAPGIVLGVINVEGRIVPVMNIRKRFALPDKEIDLNDHLIIATTAKRSVALLTDSVSGVVDVSPDAVVDCSSILPQVDYVEGIAKLPDGMVIIHDLDTFLSLDEDRALDEAMSQV
ncbi:MAG: chemotaxis protein CheW [Syntrophobacteraceae bacterium]